MYSRNDDPFERLAKDIRKRKDEEIESRRFKGADNFNLHKAVTQPTKYLEEAAGHVLVKAITKMIAGGLP